MSLSPGALRNTQVALHDHLLRRDSDLPAAFRAELQHAGPFTIEERLQVYHGAYRSRLLEALQDSFARSWTWLGDAAFAAAATGFIESHPPRDRNLRWYGDEFAGWLGAQYPTDLEVSELAHLDWRLRGAFDGVDSVPITVAALSRLGAADWNALGCRFVRTFEIAPVRFNSVAIWHALERGKTPPEAAPLAAPTWVLIWRKGWQPHFRTVALEEHRALTDLHAGASFAVVCESLCDKVSAQQAATMVATWLRVWLDDELIEALTGSTSE